MNAMSETDPYYEDDATEIASVLRTFRQINENIKTLNENIKTLNENLDDSTKTLGDLVKSEYAGELARLRESVNDLVQKQDALAKTVNKKQTAVRDLYGASRSLQDQDVKLSSVTRELEALVRWLNEIATRPAARAEQLWALICFSGAGVLAGVLMVFLGLWALPDRAETAVARTIMGSSYWTSAWRMMKVHSQSELERFAVLNEIDTDEGRLEQLKICRDQARETGERQECVVEISPGSGG